MKGQLPQRTQPTRLMCGKSAAHLTSTCVITLSPLVSGTCRFSDIGMMRLDMCLEVGKSVALSLLILVFPGLPLLASASARAAQASVRYGPSLTLAALGPTLPTTHLS